MDPSDRVVVPEWVRTTMARDDVVALYDGCAPLTDPVLSALTGAAAIIEVYAPATARAALERA